MVHSQTKIKFLVLKFLYFFLHIFADNDKAGKQNIDYHIHKNLSLISVFMSCHYVCGAGQCLVNCTGLTARSHV